MKFLPLLFAFTLLLAPRSSFAGHGVFGLGIELDGTGSGAANSGQLTLYALDNGGTTRLLPSGSSATLSTAWSGSSTQSNPSYNLGTFNPNAGDKLTLTGGSYLTYQNNSDTVNSATLNYEIYQVGSSGSGFTAVNLPNNSTNASGSNNGDQRWSIETLGTNVLSGLGNGTYEIVVYGNDNGSFGTDYESNFGNNFGAEFTVTGVPEPGTIFGSLVLVGVVVFRERQRLHRSFQMVAAGRA